MAATKRSHDQILKDREEIARLYLKGNTQAAIGARLGMTTPMVNYDLKAIRQQWLQSTLISFDERMSVELAKIDNLEIEAWAAWERSKEVREKSRTKITTDAGSERTEATVAQEQMLGDPRFLDKVQWCIERRCKIFGLDAPIKIDWREQLPAGYDADTVQRQFVELMAAAANDSTNQT